MRILSPRAHGFVDFLVVIAFLAAPRVLGFEGAPATIARVLAGVHLVLTLATDFPLGLLRVVPFPLHGLLEFGVALALLAMPWLAGFAEIESAKTFYLASGASIFLVFTITDYTRGRGA